MANVGMLASQERSRRAHHLVQAIVLAGRPYWECSCHAGRSLPSKDGEPEQASVDRAIASHTRHRTSRLAEQERR